MNVRYYSFELKKNCHNNEKFKCAKVLQKDDKLE